MWLALGPPVIRLRRPAWALDLPPGSGRSQALQQVVGSWAGLDPRAAAAFVLTQAPADCERATRFLEEALGVVSNRAKKPEYHASADLEAKRETLAKAKPLLKGKRHSGKWRRDPDLMAWLTAL